MDKEKTKDSKKSKKSSVPEEKKKIKIIGFVSGTERLTFVVQFKDDPKFYTILAEKLLPKYQIDVINFLESHVTFS